jgi:hypothetical protein
VSDLQSIIPRPSEQDLCLQRVLFEPSPAHFHLMEGTPNRLPRKCFVPKTFDGIRWSTGSTVSDTTDRLNEAGISIHVPPAWSDVDTIDDLKSLARNSQDAKFDSSRSMKYLLPHRAIWRTSHDSAVPHSRRDDPSFNARFPRPVEDVSHDLRKLVHPSYSLTKRPLLRRDQDLDCAVCALHHHPYSLRHFVQ